MPGTTYLQLVWDTLSMMTKGAISPVINVCVHKIKICICTLFIFKISKNLQVEFEDIRFLRATTMVPGKKIDFTIMVRLKNVPHWFKFRSNFFLQFQGTFWKWTV